MLYPLIPLDLDQSPINHFLKNKIYIDNQWIPWNDEYSQEFIRDNFFYYEFNKIIYANLANDIKKIQQWSMVNNNNKNIYKTNNNHIFTINEFEPKNFDPLMENYTGLGYLCHWLWSLNITDLTCFINDKVEFKIRYYGLYHTIGYGSIDQYNKFINQWKRIEKMDILSIKPQSTVIHWIYNNIKFSTRLSLYPLFKSEKLSIRILYNKFLDLDHLQLNPSVINLLKNIILKKTFFAIGGPAGTGKTTLAYGINKFLSQKGHHILSIENPIEYITEDFAQSIGDHHWDHLMRQDLDYIFMGEILSQNHSQQAINMMATGHGVIGTLHINSPIDLNHRWDNIKFYKGYILFPKIVYNDDKSWMILEIYDINGKLLSLNYQQQIDYQ